MASFPEYIFQAVAKAPSLGPEASSVVAGQEIQLVSSQGIQSSWLDMAPSSQLVTVLQLVSVSGGQEKGTGLAQENAEETSLLAFYFSKSQECQAVGMGSKANYPKRDWTWVIPFKINSGCTSTWFQFLRLCWPHVTPGTGQWRESRRWLPFQACVFRWLSLTTNAVWVVQLVSCLNATDKWKEKSIAFSKILRKLADFMIHNQPCQCHFSYDNLLKVFWGQINGLEKILVTGLPHQAKVFALHSTQSLSS